MKSPCINVCSIDEKSGLCTGCARSLEEIGNWGRMTDAQRDTIMADIDARFKAHFQSARPTKAD